MTGLIRITLKSDLCAGSGEASGTTVDREICIRDSGLPCIPARRIKGCLLDTARWLERMGEASGAVIEAVFGTNTGLTGAIRIRDALLPGTAAMESWLKQAPKPLEWAAKPLNVESLFTAVRGQTKLVDGVAADGSLRSTRVLTHHNAMDWNRDTVLEAEVRMTPPRGCNVSEEDMAALLEKCCLATRHMGSSRNRGLGNVRMAWEPTQEVLPEHGENPEDLRNNKGHNYGAVSVVLDEATERRNPLWIASDDNEVRDGGDKPECGNDCCASPKIPPSSVVEIRYTLSLDAPVSLPGNGEDHAEIPARSVIGCAASAYLKTGRAEDPLFRDLFLRGNLRFSEKDIQMDGAQWSALTPVMDGKRSVPAPLSLVRLKNDNTYRNLLLDRQRPDTREKKSRLAGYYAVPTKDGFLLAEPKTHTKYHHSHGDTGTLYMQDSLDAGMLYSGTVTVPRPLAERVLDLLKKTDFAFGRSRSAQYAVCSLYGEPEIAAVEAKTLPVGGTLYAVLESDLVLTRNGVYTADHASVRQELLETLGLHEAGHPDTPDYCQYHIIGGFQEQWHLQKPQIPAAAGGSVYCFHVSGTESRVYQTRTDGGGVESVSRFLTLGEFQQEGFGRVRIYTADEMRQRTVLKKLDAVDSLSGVHAGTAENAGTAGAENAAGQAAETAKSGTEPKTTERSGAVMELETALTAAAGRDVLRKSVRAYYDGIRREYHLRQREKGNWLRTGTIGRLRLMLAESQTWLEFLARIDGMRESDIHSQKARSEREKALELVMRFCTGDRVYEKFLKSSTAAQEGNVHIRKDQTQWAEALSQALKRSGGDRVRADAMLAWRPEEEAPLAERISSRPAVQSELEKQWGEAVRYLLYIAYYDRKG